MSAAAARWSTSTTCELPEGKEVDLERFGAKTAISMVDIVKILHRVDRLVWVLGRLSLFRLHQVQSIYCSQ